VSVKPLRSINAQCTVALSDLVGVLSSELGLQ
jgi:hypothetical protein